MIFVSDIWKNAKEIFGVCDEASLYEGINDAVELLTQKGDWSPMLAYLDICCSSRCVALPSEVETPLAVQIDGIPALSRNELYRFHINGPGENQATSGWSWENGGQSSTMRDLALPSRLVAIVDRPEDTGADLRVFGYDRFGAWVRTDRGDGTLEDGYAVPTIYGWPLPDASAPWFGRITMVRKSRTAGRIRLHSIDYQPSTEEGTLIGDYLPHELEPLYRRIRLSREACWARLFIRRKTFKVSAQTDFVPLHQRLALVLAMRSVKAYNDREVGLAMDFESNATRLLTEKEWTLSPPGPTPIQVSVEGSLYNPGTDDLGYD